MFTRELESRQLKFEKDASENRRREKEKLQRIARDRLAARKREAETEKKRKQQLLLLERLKQEEEDRQQRLREQNRGVFFETVLSPAPLSEDTAASLGIKRYKDKVMLPASMSDELMQQKAYTNGGLLFELKAENGRSTHVGVLNFSAPEGQIYLPPHVERCLSGDEERLLGKVRVSYKRLVDGTFARLQPIKQGFHEEVGEEMRDILENVLCQYSALTEGDIIRIPLPATEKEHEVKVVELTPSSAVRILHTDLEVDVLPSAEVEERLRRKLETDDATFLAGNGSNRLQKYRIAKQEEESSETVFASKPGSSSSGTKDHVPVLTSTTDVEESMGISDRSDDEEAQLPSDADAVIACSIRFPDGVSVIRRFGLDDQMSNLFRIAERRGADVIRSDQFRFVTQFPRRVFSRQEHATLTFRQCGFFKQETFFVENC